jgi:hypothetical protein
LFSAADAVTTSQLLGPNSPVHACRAFVSKLLQPLDRCCVVLDDHDELLVALDEARFLRKIIRWLASQGCDKRRSEAAAAFVKLFLRTQCCSEHTLSICRPSKQ